jgi:radical SAM family uncharacterized protein
MELDNLLLQVNKPARYIGQEWNVSNKNFNDAAVRFALCFPDLYEVGMSNLGIRIIYDILNAQPDVLCERFFSVSDDLEDKLREGGKNILSLESQKPLKEFDLIGFSLESELDYTNVLRILDLGGIPLNAAERGSNYPLVIGGGTCALNPEPMHQFFDLFLVGEAEELIVEFIDNYRKYKPSLAEGRLSKEKLLFLLSQVEGVYVPSFYETSVSCEGKMLEFRPKIEGIARRIKKRIVRDLEKARFPARWLVPYIQIIHDRVTLEIMRGCPNRCRFCQARNQYYPFRLRSQEELLRLAESAYIHSGYEELSLLGLSVSDYPGIEKLLEALNSLFRNKAVSISLPSVKPKAHVGRLSSEIAKVKKTGLTFAPEAGSVRMREILGKDFDEDDFFRSLEEAYAAGYQHVKLYFMIGIPGESEEDLDKIIDFSVRVSELKRKVKGSPAQVNISINALIPKPHTAFQWFPMPAPEVIRQKQDYLKAKCRNRRLKLTFHSIQMSFLEAVLSRGDRRLSSVIFEAFKNGAKFDAWGDHFSLDKWNEAFRKNGIDGLDYLKARSPQDILPWDFIDIGMDREELLREYNKILQ